MAETTQTDPAVTKRRLTLRRPRPRAAAAPARPASALRLVGSSFKWLWRTKGPVVAIVLIVQIPFTLLSTAGDAAVINFGQFATLIMELALLRYLAGRLDLLPRLNIKRAYYVSGSYLVRVVLVGLVVFAASLPLVLGLVFNNFGLVAAVQPADRAVISLIALGIALPSAWLLTRVILAPVLVVAEDLDPVAALKRARSLTYGWFWATLGRLTLVSVIALILIALSFAPGILAQLFWPAGLAALSLASELLLDVVVLPFVTIYLLLLMRELAAKPSGKTPKVKTKAAAKDSTS